MKTAYKILYLTAYSLLILIVSCSNNESTENPQDNTDDGIDTPDLLQGLIFETNFNNDTDYSATGLGLWNGGGSVNYDPPWGWDGVKAGNDNLIEVLSGQGVNGSNALKLNWSPNFSQPTVSLAKHLTGNVDTGLDEVYIRYHVRLPENFKAGNGDGGLNHWKWGRLWQNTWPIYESGIPDEHRWSENRENSKYIVWNFNSSIPYTGTRVAWGENTGNNLGSGSAGGERQRIDYFVSGSNQHNAPGYFESIWDINTTDNPGFINNNSADNWQTIEFRFKLATTATSDDGEFQMWWNGIDQGQFSRIIAGGNAPSRSGIPTTRDGSGLNFFVLFDNMVDWNAHWGEIGVEGGIYVNDVVIATERIGHDYIAGNTDTID